MWETVALAIQLLGWIGALMTVVAVAKFAIKTVKVSKTVKAIVATAMVGVMKLEVARMKGVVVLASAAMNIAGGQLVEVWKVRGVQAKLNQASAALITVPIVLACLPRPLMQIVVEGEVQKVKVLATMTKVTTKVVGNASV